MADTAPIPIPQRFVEAAEKPGAEASLRERLPGKLREIATDNRLVTLAREAYGYATHPAVSRRTKLMGGAALLYLIAPLDAVADWLPGVGYLDDAALLAAFVVSAREAAKEVVSHTRQAAEEVVSHAISESREAWARRGVSQVCLSLWAATVAASVGLLYYAARDAAFAGAAEGLWRDPFFWGCLVSGVFGLCYHVAFAYRVWKQYRAARPEIQEPLAYAIVSLADWKQSVALALPVVALVAVFLLRGVLTT